MFFVTWSVKGSPESLHRAPERQIVEKTSVFRDSELELVEKRSVFRDFELQRVSRESPE